MARLIQNSHLRQRLPCHLLPCGSSMPIRLSARYTASRCCAAGRTGNCPFVEVVHGILRGFIGKIFRRVPDSQDYSASGVQGQRTMQSSRTNLVIGLVKTLHSTRWETNGQYRKSQARTASHDRALCTETGNVIDLSRIPTTPISR